MTRDAHAQRVWQAALGRLQLTLPKPTFDTWLSNTTGLALGERSLTVEVPTPFTAEWLEQRMHGLIEQAVSAVGPNPCEVTYQVRGVEQAAPPEGTLFRSATPHTNSTPQALVSEGSRPTPLNDRYTFGSFVVGGSNQLAFAASRAVADAPGRSYNPLFLYGAVGLGKTHLLHAIAHQVTAAQHTVAYLTTEQFTNEYLVSIRERRTEQFRDRYRSVDLLLLDDIQFIVGKESTQEGFFHTFNALRDANRQVVITCDRPPSALPALEERLRSRLEWGLMADIGAPDYETRIAILRGLLPLSPVAVPQDVIDLIAHRVTSNVRQLESCFTRVTAMAHFTNQPVTIDLALTTLGTLVAQQASPASPKAAIDAVATYYNIPASALVGGRRDKTTAQARQVAMYLLREAFTLSPEEIGRSLGNRDRTTVLYGIKQIARRSESNQSFAATLRQLKACLATGERAPSVPEDPHHR